MLPRLTMPISHHRLAELADLPDCKIDTSDIEEASDDFFRRARLRTRNISTQDPKSPPAQSGPQN